MNNKSLVVKYSECRDKYASILILIAYCLCLILLLDPLNENWGGAAVKEIKFLPILIIIIADLLLIANIRIKVTWTIVCIFCFVLLMLSGSCYALLVLGQELEETYISRSIIALTSLIAGYLIAQSEANVRFLAPVIIRGLLIYAWIVFALTAFYRFGFAFADLVQVFQDQTVLLAGAMLLLTNNIVSTKWRVISFLVFSFSLILIAKTTALLMLSMVVSIYIYSHASNILVKIYKTKSILVLAAGAVAPIVYLVVSYLYEDRLNDRENDTREANMQIRLDQYYDSQWVGDFFSGSPLVDYGSLHIPSHSEWLDFIASSGSIFIFIFMFPVLLLIWKSRPLAFSLGQMRIRQWFAALITFYIMSMAVNPMLSLPSIAIPFWLLLGIVAAMDARRYDFVF